MKYPTLHYYIIYLCLMSSLGLLSCAQKTDPAPPNKKNYQYSEDRNHASDEALCATGTFETAIVGGEKVKKTSWVSQGTVFIFIYQKDLNKQTMCSGTLIDRNIVLTAAHCVDESVDNPENISVFFSSQPDCDRENEVLEPKKRSVESIIVHPAWNTNGLHAIGHGDLALLRLQGRAPGDSRAVRLSPEFLMAPAQPILLAGFGMVTPNYYSTKPNAPVSLRATYTHELTADQRAYLVSIASVNRNPSPAELQEFDNLATNELLYVDQSQGDGICGGDSGGPSFMKDSRGEYVQVGVASFVMNPFDPSLLCGYAAAHTSVYFMRDWLERAFSEIKNGISQKKSPFQ